MTKLVINSITNCQNDPEMGDCFDVIFAELQTLVNKTCAAGDPDGYLGCVFVQYQYDANWDNAANGIKIGRYSKKHNDVQAYIEIRAIDIKAKNKKEQKRYLGAKLIEVLSSVKEINEGKVPHHLDELLVTVNNIVIKWEAM